MRISIRDAVIVAAFSACGTVALGARAPQAHPHPVESGAHHHPDAAGLKNAVPVSAASIGDGEAIDRQPLRVVVNCVRSLGPWTGFH